jgi:hypothetical protein
MIKRRIGFGHVRSKVDIISYHKVVVKFIIGIFSL